MLLLLPLASFLSGPVQGEACYISAAFRISARLLSPVFVSPCSFVSFAFLHLFFVGFLVLSSVLPPPSVPPPLFISPFSLLSPLLVSRVFFFPCPFCSLAFSFVSFCASPCAPLGILSLKIGREGGSPLREGAFPAFALGDSHALVFNGF